MSRKMFVFFLAMVGVTSCVERLPMAIDDNVYEILMKGLEEGKIDMTRKNGPVPAAKRKAYLLMRSKKYSMSPYSFGRYKHRYSYKCNICTPDFNI